MTKFVILYNCTKNRAINTNNLEAVYIYPNQCKALKICWHIFLIIPYLLLPVNYMAY